MIGQPLTEFFQGRDLEKLVEVLGNVATTGKPVTTEPMYVRAAGYVGDAEDQFIHSVVPVHNADGAKPERLFIYTEKA